MKFFGDFVSSAVVAVVLIITTCAIGWAIMEMLF